MKTARYLMAGATALLLMPGAITGASAAEPPKPAAPYAAASKPAPDLFLAIGMSDARAVEALLRQGVAPDSQNTLGMTGLTEAAGIGNVEICKLLIAAGADVNAKSMMGTPLSFATMSGQGNVVRLLIEKGATVNAERPDRISPLMMQSRAGGTELVKLLLAKGADLHAVDNSGANALSHAARRGHLGEARVLLQAGAKVDLADAQGLTPLMHAAMNGYGEMVTLLAGRKANVNAMDKQGRTALALAASYGDHPATIRALLAAGAKPATRDAKGRTPLMAADARGYTETARILKAAGAKLPANWQRPARTPRQAAAMALPRIEQSMEMFSKRTGCVSCHHEGMGRWATGTAAAYGFRLNQPVANAQHTRIIEQLKQLEPLHRRALGDPAEIKNVPIVDIGDIPPSYGSILPGLMAHGVKGSPEVAASAAFLGRMQMPGGEWIFGFQRVPVQSSFFTSTATAIRTLRAYEPAGQPTDLDQRIARAKDWLLKTPVRTNEDRVFRLLGLEWAGASAADKLTAYAELRQSQRPDGGWAQEPGMASDAYATGSAIYALRTAGGATAADPIIRKGVRFLLRTQEDDGTWYVAKRAIPANNYFDTGFPYGQSQYSSFAGTSWALMALFVADDQPTPQAARRAAR